MYHFTVVEKYYIEFDHLFPPNYLCMLIMYKGSTVYICTRCLAVNTQISPDNIIIFMPTTNMFFCNSRLYQWTDIFFFFGSFYSFFFKRASPIFTEISKIWCHCSEIYVFNRFKIDFGYQYLCVYYKQFYIQI